MLYVFKYISKKVVKAGKIMNLSNVCVKDG